MPVSPSNFAIVYDYAAIIGGLVAGKYPHGQWGAYFEFANVATPPTTVAEPAIELSDGIEYYSDLSLTVDRDFLRVTSLLGSVTSTDGDFPRGNKLNVIAQTVGDTGVHGRPFASGSNSLLYGVALVFMPDVDDRLQDLLLYRHYYPTAEQRVKSAGEQMTAAINIAFS